MCKGHILRADVSSSTFLRFYVNPNTGAGIPGTAGVMGGAVVVSKRVCRHGTCRASQLAIECYQPKPSEVVSVDGPRL
jgi:predicted acyl esterase